MSEVTFSGNTIGDKALYLKGIEHGTRDEQERIIKLLEGLIDNRATYEMPMEYWVQNKLLEYAIALIKGGNK